MGGDRAPGEIVAGACACARATGCRVLLVGDEQKIRPLMAGAPASVELVGVTQSVTMNESPAAAVRRGSATSMGRTIDLVREGAADAAFSAGNSGAFLALATIRLRTLPGIGRAAFATVWPARKGPMLLLDAGANVDCRPEWIAQFALMGTAYARGVLEISDPKVGLLSIGEEETKGNALTEAAHPLLAAAPIHFIGNVEGRDLLLGDADVVVCDGFVGNVALKAAEGTAEYIFGAVKSAVQAGVIGRLGGALLGPSLRRVRDRLDYREYGAAPLLGVRGICLVGHGRADARAADNACRTAVRAVRQDVVGAIARMLAPAPAQQMAP